MGQIRETYASPGLRVGLLLEDHPNARIEYTMEKGTDLGIPERCGGEGDFCVATITFSNGRQARGWKPLPGSDVDADGWNKLCTQAMGRALKRCGYPDDTLDLKLLVTWRQRRVELARLAAGITDVALPSAQDEAQREALGTGSIDPVQRALDRAGVATAGGGDDGEGEVGGDDDVVEGEFSDDIETVIELIDGLTGNDVKLFGAFIDGTLNVKSEDPRDWTADQISQALAWLDPEGDDGE